MWLGLMLFSVLSPDTFFGKRLAVKSITLMSMSSRNTSAYSSSKWDCWMIKSNALVCGIVQLVGKSLYRFIYGDEPVSSHPIEMKRDGRLYLS